MNVSELLIHGKCPRCGNSLQINYNLIEPATTNTPTTTKSTNETGSANQMQNLDETLFDPEFPTQSIKDLIEGE